MTTNPLGTPAPWPLPDGRAGSTTALATAVGEAAAFAFLAAGYNTTHVVALKINAARGQRSLSLSTCVRPPSAGSSEAQFRRHLQGVALTQRARLRRWVPTAVACTLMRRLPALHQWDGQALRDLKKRMALLVPSWGEASVVGSGAVRAAVDSIPVSHLFDHDLPVADMFLPISTFTSLKDGDLISWRGRGRVAARGTAPLFGRLRAAWIMLS